MSYDVIVVGGGPAGLSAALLLGRCLRRVLVIDSGEYRNGTSRAMHGFVSRDGINPRDFLAIVRNELRGYGVEVLRARVRQARRVGAGFQVVLEDGSVRDARKLLLATGVTDNLPAIPGLKAAWGRSAFACPFCDGYENRDTTIGVLGEDGAELARVLQHWSDDVSLFTHGKALTSAEMNMMREAGIPVITTAVNQLIERDGQLHEVKFANGEVRPIDCLFVRRGVRPRSELARQLGLQVDADVGVMADGTKSGVPGVFVAGDATRDHLFAVVAAAEGTTAGQAIHLELAREAGRLPRH